MKHQVSGEGSGKRVWLLGLGLVAGAVGGFALGRRLAAPRRMPNLDLWQRALEKKHGEVRAAMLAARAQARYEDLYAHRPCFANRALRVHVEDHILPGLALYQVLREEEGNDKNEDEQRQDAALAEMEALFEIAYGRFRGWVALLGRLPDPFGVFRRMARWALRWIFPPQGWEIDWVEDSERCLAFDISRCIYLDLLTSYDAPELTWLYCGLDDLLCESLPPTITWERTKARGRGDEVCDFRWCRATPE